MDGQPRLRCVRVDYRALAAADRRREFEADGRQPARQPGQLKVPEAALAPLGFVGSAALAGPEPFGHDGPNYWTGTLALPMIVQHENAVIQTLRLYQVVGTLRRNNPS